MGVRKNYAPADIVRWQFDYEETDRPVKDIAREMKRSRSSFYAFVKEHNWRRRSDGHPRVAAAAPPPSEPAPEAVVDHLERTVERELDAIEKILARLPRGDDRAMQAERAARTLASLTRTLNEVQRLRRAQAANGPTPAQTESADDDDMPRDIDEFRRELARRIDAFVAGRSDPPVPDDAA